MRGRATRSSDLRAGPWLNDRSRAHGLADRPSTSAAKRVARHSRQSRGRFSGCRRATRAYPHVRMSDGATRTPMSAPTDRRVAVVVASRNRRELLLQTLPLHLALPERPRVVLVDDGSTDGTAAAVTAKLTAVDVVRLPC